MCNAGCEELKLSPGHKPSVPEKPQPSPEDPRRSEVTPHQPHLPVMGFATYEILPTAGILPHRPWAVKDRHTARKQAGTTQHCARGCGRRRAPSQKAWPCEGLGNSSEALGLLPRMFSTLGTQGRSAALLQPGSQLATGL